MLAPLFAEIDGRGGACALVAEVALPPGAEPPRVVLCGRRAFVRDDVAPHAIAYVEATVAQLPELASERPRRGGDRCATVNRMRLLLAKGGSPP